MPVEPAGSPPQPAAREPRSHPQMLRVAHGATRASPALSGEGVQSDGDVCMDDPRAIKSYCTLWELSKGLRLEHGHARAVLTAWGRVGSSCGCMHVAMQAARRGLTIVWPFYCMGPPTA